MKKIIAIFLATVFAVCLCACEDGGATAIGQGRKGTIETSGSESSGSVQGDASNSSAGQATTTTAANIGNSGENGEITVTENMYVTYINEIYTNYKKYEGYKITIEGMYSCEQAESNTYRYVYRTGPGCCGNDGAMCGFEFTTSDKIPSMNDWIRVTGTLRSYEEDGRLYLTLDNSKCEILDDSQRGAETVS